VSIERERLLALGEFAQQSARLRSTPVSTVSQHGIFSLYEHQIQNLPGVTLNAGDGERGDEVWLIVKRLHETKAPEIVSSILKPWVLITNNPGDEPKLKEAIDEKTLIDSMALQAGLDVSGRWQKEPSLRGDPAKLVTLSECAKAAVIKSQFANYLDSKWRPWAEVEKSRRKTIQIYAQLFTLKQKLEGGIVETQLELVWGVGIGLWQRREGSVSYPLVGRLSEISLNPDSADIEIRPRDQDARLEVDWYASVDNQGVAELEKAAKNFFSHATTTFSPFDRGSFEPLLRTAVTNLDANGIYWPNEAPADDRVLPKADQVLKVTDTWVLFARPRTNSIFLQDLEKLKQKAAEIQDPSDFPAAVAALVTAPDDANPVVHLPGFRGVSNSYTSESGQSQEVAPVV